ncbi:MULTISPECIES: ketol-acid reductoisomerase [unclassified Asticcacaulis]|uniref:ketol-acid reductoisomerase n=1 Tax=unclassified Asticcacaulis TaxID=2628350 RepID=UPI0003C3AFEE|nr:MULTISPECIES: ketol-acid reductoisomerase [unclassified Asticcacaulis]ESQ84921.1 ketol-acid reductoisomerase [Asticcacaulis sp. AC466]MDV6332334.1 ketol-acid reductoisomerase [Asticcacaulis sp. 201]
MKIYTNDDVSPDSLKGERIAIIGYGSQGRAHAQNLRDSGADVIVGVRPGGAGEEKAKHDGLQTADLADAVKDATIIAILTPDMSHAEIYSNIIEKHAPKGSALLFAHGFSVLYGRVVPRADMDVILVAPKGPGDLVRREYQRGRGVPSLFAVDKDVSGQAARKALGYARGIGGTVGGVIETSFKEETETDLFGEQAVLCGGTTELVLMGFETLVEAGYRPEIAYFECLHELKLIVDLLYEGGFAKMHSFVSETCKYGDLVSGPRIINAETRERMRDVLKDIQSANFARDWILENQAGRPRYNALMNADLNHPIEKVGKDLRGRMSWLQNKANVDA